MGRLIPAGRGLEYYRGVKIAGEDVVEEEMLPKPDVIEAIPGYDEEARTLYSGGLTEADVDTLAE
jgi:DNA-directed RNA polymerase subunit beta'